MRAVWIALFRRIDWSFLACLGVMITLMAPLLKTDYLGDDNGGSLVHGILKYQHLSLADLLILDLKGWLQAARFFPLATTSRYLIFYVITDRFAYKLFILLCLSLNVSAFYLLVRKLTGSPPLALVNILIVPALFQFRCFHDPILAFSGLLQLVWLGLLASYLSLIRHLETGRWRWLLLSFVTLLGACLAYEISYLLVTVHLIILARFEGLTARAVRRGAFLASAVIFCTGVSLVLRMLPGFKAPPAYTPNSAPLPFFAMLGKQLLASLPMSYRLASVRPPPGEAHSRLFRWLLPAGVAVGLWIGFALLAKLRAQVQGGTVTRGRLLVVVGLLFWILPAIPISFSPRYQTEVTVGLGYLPVYLQYYGVTCLITGFLLFLLKQLKPYPRASTVGIGIAAGLIVLAMTLTYQMNLRVIGVLSTEMQPRLYAEAAINTGLMADVPEGSAVLMEEGSAWWNSLYSPYFFATYAGRDFRILLSNERETGREDIHNPLGLGDSWYVPPDSTSPAAFEIRDGSVHRKSSYLFLCHLVTVPEIGADQSFDHAATEIRLFVRNENSARERPHVFVTGKYRDTQHSVFFFTSEQMETLSAKGEGTVYLVPINGKVIDARSLSAGAFTRSAEIAYKSGFYSTEYQANWRWAQSTATLDLINCTMRPATFELSMSLAALTASTVTIQGATISDRVPVGEVDVRRTWKVTVPPGPNTIYFSSDSGVLHVPNDPRNLAFSILNVTVKEIADDSAN